MRILLVLLATGVPIQVHGRNGSTNTTTSVSKSRQPFGVVAPLKPSPVLFHINPPHTINQSYRVASKVQLLPSRSAVPPTSHHDAKLLTSSREEVISVTGFPSKETYTSMIHGVEFYPRGSTIPHDIHRRRTHIWVEHPPTHSKHKFTIVNLGQSKEVLREFYRGSNGGKPYVARHPPAASSTDKPVDKLSSQEMSAIVEKIIKQELNRAKVAKFGKSAGGTYEENISGQGGGASGAAQIETSGYLEESSTLIDWSITNNNVDEFPHGYDGLSELPVQLPSARPSLSLNTQVTDDHTAPPPAITVAAPTAPPTTHLYNFVTDQNVYKPISSWTEGATSSPNSDVSSPAPGAPLSSFHVLEYPLLKSNLVDGSVTGHPCLPCAGPTNISSVSPAPTAQIFPGTLLPVHLSAYTLARKTNQNYPDHVSEGVTALSTSTARYIAEAPLQVLPPPSPSSSAKSQIEVTPAKTPALDIHNYSKDILQPSPAVPAPSAPIFAPAPSPLYSLPVSSASYSPDQVASVDQNPSAHVAAPQAQIYSTQFTPQPSSVAPQLSKDYSLHSGKLNAEGTVGSKYEQPYAGSKQAEVSQSPSPSARFTELPSLSSVPYSPHLVHSFSLPDTPPQAHPAPSPPLSVPYSPDTFLPSPPHFLPEVSPSALLLPPPPPSVPGIHRPAPPPSSPLPEQYSPAASLPTPSHPLSEVNPSTPLLPTPHSVLGLHQPALTLPPPSPPLPAQYSQDTSLPPPHSLSALNLSAPPLPPPPPSVHGLHRPAPPLPAPSPSLLGPYSPAASLPISSHTLSEVNPLTPLLPSPHSVLGLHQPALTRSPPSPSLSAPYSQDTSLLPPHSLPALNPSAPPLPPPPPSVAGLYKPAPPLPPPSPSLPEPNLSAPPPPPPYLVTELYQPASPPPSPPPSLHKPYSPTTPLPPPSHLLSQLIPSAQSLPSPHSMPELYQPAPSLTVPAPSLRELHRPAPPLLPSPSLPLATPLPAPLSTLPQPSLPFPHRAIEIYSPNKEFYSHSGAFNSKEAANIGEGPTSIGDSPPERSGLPSAAYTPAPTASYPRESETTRVSTSPSSLSYVPNQREVTEESSFVQEPEDKPEQSSHSKLEQDHIEAVAEIFPSLPVVQKEMVGPHFSNAVENLLPRPEAPEPVVTIPVPSNYRETPSSSYSPSIEEQYTSSSTTQYFSAPPELEDLTTPGETALISPSALERPSIEIPASGSSQYINVSPGSSSGETASLSEKVSYIPETAPALPELAEAGPSKVEVEASNYANLEGDHERGPITVIDIETHVMKPTKTSPAVKEEKYGENRLPFKITPYIRVRPSSLSKNANQPTEFLPTRTFQYFTSPTPTFRQPLQPLAVPRRPLPYPNFPQVAAPQYNQPYQLPQYSQAGCCGGRPFNQQGGLCVPINYSPCWPSPQPQQPLPLPQPQQYHTQIQQQYQYNTQQNYGCGACSPTCTPACAPPPPPAPPSCAPNCCPNQSPACCQPMTSICCNPVVQSCCPAQQQQCCNAQVQSCCSVPIQSCCCPTNQMAGICSRRSKRYTNRSDDYLVFVVPAHVNYCNTNDLSSFYY